VSLPLTRSGRGEEAAVKWKERREEEEKVEADPSTSTQLFLGHLGVMTA
jgi:hypothetical protein